MVLVLLSGGLPAGSGTAAHGANGGRFVDGTNSSERYCCDLRRRRQW